MTLSTRAFERIGLRVRPEEFAQLVEEALAEVLPLRPGPAPNVLTIEEARILEEGGGALEPRARGADSPLVRTAAEYVAVLASSLTVPEAAQHLGVDGSRVRQRLAAHTLYGIKQPSGWRLPHFQFAHSGLLPGFERIGPRLVGIHPVSVVRWFNRPHGDLTLDDDEPVSPRAWLELGLDPDRVAALADELGGVA